jgi:hypothetical protein
LALFQKGKKKTFFMQILKFNDVEKLTNATHSRSYFVVGFLSLFFKLFDPCCVGIVGMKFDCIIFLILMFAREKLIV